ncbi:tetratricopeptide repeat protein [Acetobacter conturbans]|uniref:tetratricopeptide repeat protein n=1 Tax=Acetobacter conturbans TaxID=1737472 RepID=UPI001F55A8F0|nr:hypothetical protein [Acetobacter conturbans]
MARKRVSPSRSRKVPAPDAAEALTAEIRKEGVTPRPAGLITPEDRENWKKWASEQAQDAFRRGEACLSAGDAAEALGWLERAYRMAADSPNVALLLAIARQACGYRTEAIALLKNLAATYDSGQI